MAQVLVVEEDEAIGRTLTSSLGVHGHTARWVMTGAAALSAAEQQQFDLALLDLGLPDMDGVDVCRRLRAAQPGCVLVVLTARDEEIDVVVGLEAGADDSQTSPSRLAERLARVAAPLRLGPAPRPDVPVSPEAVLVGALHVDAVTRRVHLGGVEIELR